MSPFFPSNRRVGRVHFSSPTVGEFICRRSPGILQPQLPSSRVLVMGQAAKSWNFMNTLRDHVHQIVQVLLPDLPSRQCFNLYRLCGWEFVWRARKWGKVQCPPQYPNLNIIEDLWCVLVRQVRNRYPPPFCLKKLEQVLMEEWLGISLGQEAVWFHY